MRYLNEDDLHKYAEAFYKIANKLHYAAVRSIQIPFQGEETKLIVHDWYRYDNSAKIHKSYVTDVLCFTLEIAEYFYIYCEYEKDFKDGSRPQELLSYTGYDMSLNRIKCTFYEDTINADEFDNYMVTATLMAMDLKATRNGY